MLAPLPIFFIILRGVFKTQSKIQDGVILRNFFREKASSQVFNWVPNAPLICQMNSERILIIPLISQIVCEAESLLLGKGNLIFICQSVLIKWNSRDTRFGFWLINIGWLQKLIVRLAFTFSLLKSGFEYICNVFFIR